MGTTVAAVHHQRQDQRHAGVACGRGTLGAPGRAALVVALLAALSAPVWAISLLPHVDLWTTDDGAVHLLRVFIVDRWLGEAREYPRWIPDLYRGYGYPVFNYYPVLTYVLGAAVHRLGRVSIYTASQFLQVAAVGLGAGGTFLLARHLWRTRGGQGSAPAARWRGTAVAATAAAVYVAAPYPFLVNLYLRGDLPEALALGMLPWLLLAIQRLWEAPPAKVLTSALLAGAAGAALLLTHPLSALLAAACAGLWVAVQAAAALTHGTSWRSLLAAVRALTAAGALAFGAAAFSAVPALTEGGAVQLFLLQHPASEVLYRLANPLGTTPATLHPRYVGSRAGASQWTWSFAYQWRGKGGQDGPVKPSLQQTLALALAGAALARAWWTRRGAAPRPGRPVLEEARGAGEAGEAGEVGATGRRIRGAALGAAAVIVAVTWYLNTTWSGALWAHVAALRFVQFPSRLYGPFALGVALVVSGALAALPWRTPGIAAAGLCVAAAMASGSLGALPVPRSAEVPRRVDETTLVRSEYIEDAWAGGGLAGSGEFTPRDVVIAASEPGRPRGNQLFDRLYPPASWIGSTLLVYAGEARVVDLHGAGLRRSATLDVAGGGATLAWRQLFYPGWRAYVDGRPAAINVPPYRADEDSTLGFQLVDVPAGRHTVTLVFGSTPQRLAGDAITLLTLLVALTLLGGAAAHGRRSPGARGAGQGAGSRAWSARLRSAQWWGCAALALLAFGAAWQLGVEAWRTVSVAPAGGPNRLVVDVAEAVRMGAARLDSPAGARLGADAFLDVGWLRLGPLEPGGGPGAYGGRARRWLYMHPPSQATVRFRVPDRTAVFQSGMALRPDAWTSEFGDGVRFSVDVSTAGGEPTQVYTLRLNPRAHEDERRWVEARVPLGAYAGQEIELTLRTDPAEDVRFDWAGWGNPLVVLDPTILRPANGPRPPASVAAAP